MQWRRSASRPTISRSSSYLKRRYINLRAIISRATISSASHVGYFWDIVRANGSLQLYQVSFWLDFLPTQMVGCTADWMRKNARVTKLKLGKKHRVVKKKKTRETPSLRWDEDFYSFQVFFPSGWRERMYLRPAESVLRRLPRHIRWRGRFSFSEAFQNDAWRT